jgi:hypothetical protein
MKRVFLFLFVLCLVFLSASPYPSNAAGLDTAVRIVAGSAVERSVLAVANRIGVRLANEEAERVLMGRVNYIIARDVEYSSNPLLRAADGVQIPPNRLSRERIIEMINDLDKKPDVPLEYSPRWLEDTKPLPKYIKDPLTEEIVQNIPVPIDVSPITSRLPSPSSGIGKIAVETASFLLCADLIMQAIDSINSSYQKQMQLNILRMVNDNTPRTPIPSAPVEETSGHGVDFRVEFVEYHPGRTPYNYEYKLSADVGLGMKTITHWDYDSWVTPTVKILDNSLKKNYYRKLTRVYERSGSYSYAHSIWVYDPYYHILPVDIDGINLGFFSSSSNVDVYYRPVKDIDFSSDSVNMEGVSIPNPGGRVFPVSDWFWEPNGPDVPPVEFDTIKVSNPGITITQRPEFIPRTPDTQTMPETYPQEELLPKKIELPVPVSDHFPVADLISTSFPKVAFDPEITTKVDTGTYPSTWQTPNPTTWPDPVFNPSPFPNPTPIPTPSPLPLPQPTPVPTPPTTENPPDVCQCGNVKPGEYPFWKPWVFILPFLDLLVACLFYVFRLLSFVYSLHNIQAIAIPYDGFRWFREFNLAGFQIYDTVLYLVSFAIGLSLFRLIRAMLGR